MSTTYVSDGDLANPENFNLWLNRAAGEIFSVKAYEASGDGVTDDTSAFNAAYAAVVAAGGGTVYVPEGTYLLSTITEFDAGLQQGVLEITDDNITFEFAPEAKVVGSKSVGAAASGYAIFVVKGASNFTLRGGIFDGSNARTANGLGTVISFRPGDSAGSRIRIENVTGINLRYIAINTQSVTSLNAPIFTDVKITGCTFDECNGHGIVTEGMDDVDVSHNTISSCYTSAFSAYGLDLSDITNRTTAIGNRIYDCDYGVKLESEADSGTESFDAILSSNVIIAGPNTTGYGLRVSAERSVVSDNVVKGAFSYGFRIESTDLQTAIISGNIFDGATNLGVVWDLGSTSGTFVQRDRVKISGNIFANHSTSGLDIRSSGVLIDGNLFYEIGSSFVRVRNDDADGTDTYDRISITGNKVWACGGLFTDEKVGQKANYYLISGNHLYLDVNVTATITAVDNIVYSNNVIEQTATGRRGQFFDDCDNLVIVGNRVSTSNEECIHLFECDNFLVAYNVVGGGSHGIRTQSTVTKGRVEGNYDVGSSTPLLFDANTIVNGLATETANAETPTAASWEPGDIVEFTDSGDASGDGVYILGRDGSTWTQLG